MRQIQLIIEFTEGCIISFEVSQFLGNLLAHGLPDHVMQEGHFPVSPEEAVGAAAGVADDDGLLIAPTVIPQRRDRA